MPHLTRQATRLALLTAATLAFAPATNGCSAPAERTATPAQTTATATLPSWNGGPAKSAIVAFVTRVTTEGSPDFVPVAERIAVFDNDGTLWSDQPVPFQLQFALAQVKGRAPRHPEWKT